MSSDGIRHMHISGAVFFGVERKEAGDVTEDEDDIPQGVLEGARTELEKELVQALRLKADDIDRNGVLKAKVRQSMQNVTGLMAYSSFSSTVQQYAENLVGLSRIAFVFEFTKKAIHAAGTGGLNAMRIKENCLRYVEDKCADWIVRHGGWASMLSGDSDDSTSELD